MLPKFLTSSLTLRSPADDSRGTHSLKNDLQTRVLALCCAGALTALTACSSTTSADAIDSTVADTVAPATTVEDTSSGTAEPEPTVPVTVPRTTAPDTTVPETTTTVVNVEVVGPAAVSIVAVGKSDGPDTKAAQERLLQLGFWPGDVDGEYGFATTQAVMAFQKYLGLDPSGSLDADTASWLSVFPERARGSADDGTLVEIDKGKQLLFIIQDGRTIWAFNTSTGSEIPYTATNQKTGEPESGDAVTPNGLHRVKRERPNGWWEGDLGDIYRPKYFIGGVAIHGMTRVPNKPVSHGCVRLSVAAMDFIWENDLVPLGSIVWVHE